MTFDGPNALIILDPGTTSISVRDVVSRWADWVATSDNAKYLPAFSTLGGDAIDPIAGTFVPVYAFLLNGWKLRPQAANHTLAVGDGILLVDGGGDPFVNPTGTYTVRINYQQPVQAISFDAGGGGGGGGGLTVDQAAQLIDLWRVLGLDASQPLTVTPSRRYAGDSGSPVIDQTIAGNAKTLSTVTRQ